MYDGKPQPPDHETARGLIRFTTCRKSCPEHCTNNGRWQYYDDTDQDNEWLTDAYITLTCASGRM